MLVFGAYGGQRLTLEIPTGMTVQGLKEMIQERLGISVDLYRQDKKVLVVSYGGSDLGDSWVFTDLGILPGTTIRIQLKEEVKPVLFIKCSHSQETISIFEDITIGHMQIDKVRSMASNKSGLPIGIFRLCTQDGREMFDHHRLEDYGVDVGHTIMLENWDGWTEFLNLAIMGFTPQVLSQIGGEEIIARYQMKVALFIAAHFGHVDLARSMLKQGVKSDDPTGYHPSRQWCKENGHIDALKCPVHEATHCGQLGVLRLFVNVDITCLKAKNGYDLEPLNIALREKVKNCASFILTKQWTKVNINKYFSLHLATYSRLKKWCERAKERALIKYGPIKSTLKRRNFSSGPLVSHGILVDGFSKSPMTGKTKAVLQKEEKEKEARERRRPRYTIPVGEVLGSTEEPETYFRTVAAAQNTRVQGGPPKLPTKWGKALLASKPSKGDLTARETQADAKRAVTMKSPREGSSPPPNAESSETMESDTIPKLPPIMQRMRMRLMSQSQAPEPTSSKVEPTPRMVKTERDNPNPSSNPINKSDAGKGSMLRLIKSKNAYFMSSSSGVNSMSSKGGGSVSLVLNLNSQQQPQPPLQPPPAPSERSDKSKVEQQSISAMSDRSGDQKTLWKSHTAPSVISQSTDDNAQATASDDMDGRVKAGRGAGKKRKARVSSALLLSKAKSSEGSIPLPLISHEQDRRPFFYHQGMREDDLVDDALDLVSKYKGDSSRERAIRSLTMANSFTDKPWLGQVRVALNLTTNSLKRNVRRLKGRNRNYAKS